MRISDWSSDVCSSDLGDLGENLPGYHLTNFRITCNGVAGSNLDAAVLVRNAFDKKYIAAFNVLGPTFPVNAVSVGEQRVWDVELHYQDRKSVVCGKSVSVRVDLGGRRNIEKNNYNIFFYSIYQLTINLIYPNTYNPK